MNLPILGYELPSGGRLERQTYEGRDWWVVKFSSLRLSKEGHWDYEPLNSSKTSDWIDAHRFETPEEAFEVYKKYDK